jgi:Ca2+-binding EF-hand superfamily protein
MFKIMDDDNSRSLSLYEFTKAMRDFKVGIAEEYISTIFNAFDLNRDGVLDIDEFLMAIRGDLNSFRLDLVQQAFKKLDKNNNGQVELADIRGLYRADRHPDVISGKRTED